MMIELTCAICGKKYQFVVEDREKNLERKQPEGYCQCSPVERQLEELMSDEE